jgi:hypothetical protein
MAVYVPITVLPKIKKKMRSMQQDLLHHSHHTKSELLFQKIGDWIWRAGQSKDVVATEQN